MDINKNRINPIRNDDGNKKQWRIGFNIEGKKIVKAFAVLSKSFTCIHGRKRF